MKTFWKLTTRPINRDLSLLIFDFLLGKTTRQASEWVNDLLDELLLLFMTGFHILLVVFLVQ